MSEQAYVCRMHPEVRQPHVGACPKCGMDLVPEGARFAMLRHMMSMPRHMIRDPMVLINGRRNGRHDRDHDALAALSPEKGPRL
jgi:hypothetical protein